MKRQSRSFATTCPQTTRCAARKECRALRARARTPGMGGWQGNRIARLIACIAFLLAGDAGMAGAAFLQSELPLEPVLATPSELLANSTANVTVTDALALTVRRPWVLQCTHRVAGSAASRCSLRKRPPWASRPRHVGGKHRRLQLPHACTLNPRPLPPPAPGRLLPARDCAGPGFWRAAAAGVPGGLVGPVDKAKAAQAAAAPS
jgi:hypothetical protein